jgi:cytochrome c-type biogenesis protein CcmH
MIWFVFALLTVATLALLLVPLLRSRAAPVGRAEYDLTVYKDQLAEIEREMERGVLKPDQAEAARTEIQRRILGAGDRREKVGAVARRPVGLALLIAALVPMVAAGFYLRLGAPTLPDRPYAERAGQIREMADQAEMIKSMIASLTAKLEQNPADGKGWNMLGRSLKVMGQTEKAAAAYRKAVALLPGDVAVRMELAGLLLDEVPQGMALPAELVRLMREVAAIDPRNVDALYFLGIAAAQAGEKDKAIDLWRRAAALLPDGSDDKADILKQIETLK